MLRNLDLLEIEIDTNWLRDERGRLVRERRPGGLAAPHLVVAVSGSGWRLALGDEVPDALAAKLQAMVSAEAPSAPSEPPGILAPCKELLRTSLGGAKLSGGPSYVIPRGTAFPSATEIQHSDNHDAKLLSGQDVRRLNWPADEWRQLLAAELGPWAMAVIDRQVVSICHSARLTDHAAEAGVWTDPSFRGQGHAAAVTAAWAALIAPSGRHLFYSTSATNFSSQRVAARLRLRPIGWMWRLAPLIAG